MATKHYPFLEIFYVLFPFGGSRSVVDFWSSFFTTQTGSEESLEQFPTQVAHSLGQLGFKGDTDGASQSVSFSSGVIGVARPMLVLHNNRASACLYFKRIADYAYISLRVAYDQPLSFLKLIRFALVVTALGVFSMVSEALSNYPYNYLYSSYYESQGEYIMRYIENAFTYHLEETLMRLFIIALFVFLVWGCFSWWRTGRFLSFLREDFQELYRDDMASIGEAAYQTIVSVADSLSLQAVTPLEENPRPAFGTGTTLAQNRRAPRL